MLPLTSTFPFTGMLANQVYQAIDLGRTVQIIPYSANRRLTASIVPNANTTGPLGLRNMALPNAGPRMTSETSVTKEMKWSSIFIAVSRWILFSWPVTLIANFGFWLRQKQVDLIFNDAVSK